MQYNTEVDPAETPEPPQQSRKNAMVYPDVGEMPQVSNIVTPLGLTIEIEAVLRRGVSLPEQDFECPINHIIFVDPVVISDGYSYERTCANQWLDTKNTSPMTSLRLRDCIVCSNSTLRELIARLPLQDNLIKLEDLLSPITGQIMRDPVVAVDGYTYEREEIENLFSQDGCLQKIRSPITQQRIWSKTLITNQRMRTIIHDALQEAARQVCRERQDPMLINAPLVAQQQEYKNKQQWQRMQQMRYAQNMAMQKLAAEPDTPRGCLSFFLGN